jgi:integration host factor subunit beta
LNVAKLPELLGVRLTGSSPICHSAPAEVAMIKSELIQRISSQNPHLYQRDIENMVNAILDKIVKALHSGDRVELRDFGVFYAKIRGARMGHNPKTGDEVQVAQKVIPFFKRKRNARTA